MCPLTFRIAVAVEFNAMGLDVENIRNFPKSNAAQVEPERTALLFFQDGSCKLNGRIVRLCRCDESGNEKRGERGYPCQRASEFSHMASYTIAADAISQDWPPVD